MDEKRFQEFLRENPDYGKLPRPDQLVLYGNHLTVQALGDPETVVGVLGKYPVAAEAVRKYLLTDPEMRKYFEQDPHMEDFYRARFGDAQLPAAKAEAKIHHDWDIIHAQTDALLRELVQLGLISQTEIDSAPEVPATYSPHARKAIAKAMEELKRRGVSLSERESNLSERKREIAEGFAKDEKKLYDILERHAKAAYNRAVRAGLKPRGPPNREKAEPGDYSSFVLEYLNYVEKLLGDSDGSKSTKDEEEESAEQFECPACSKSVDAKDTECPRCHVEFEE